MNIAKTVQFILLHHGAIFLFLLLAYLTGYACLRTLTIPDKISATFVYTSFGLGAQILILFCLGLLHLFNRTTTIIALLAFPSVMILRIGLFKFYSDISNIIKSRHEVFKTNWGWAAPIIILLYLLLMEPLYPPTDWDEISYHLPYAKYYVDNSGLAVNTFLRYPVFTHNFNLLYSLALLFYDDILAHLFHASAAMLTALGIYSLGVFTSHKIAGVLASLMFITSPSIIRLMNTSYIDLGLTLFVFFAFFCMVLWTKTDDIKWLLLAGFALGIAAGTKYLGLTYIPFFVAWVAYHNRKWKNVLSFCFVLLVFGSPWYVRNVVIAGNPISPFGGELFGYWIWDQHDLIAQSKDLLQGQGIDRSLRSLAILPWKIINEPLIFGDHGISSFILVIFPAILFYKKFNSLNRWMIAYSFANIFLWFYSTQIMRYLAPTLPMMALLAGYIFFSLYHYIKTNFPLSFFSSGLDSLRFSNIRNFFSNMKINRLMLHVRILLVASSIITTINTTRHDFSKKPLPIDEKSRNEYLSKNVSSFDLIQIANKQPDLAIYQLGFENGRYFSEGKMIGDWFGPAKYAKIFDVINNPSDLFHTLKALDVQLFLINIRDKPFKDYLPHVSSFDSHFVLIYKNEKGLLYLLKNI